MSTRAYAAHNSATPLAPFSITRREPLDGDVEIEILYCGVCHSDLHWARNEWGQSQFPCVPGHEIVGRVTRVGNAVRRFKEGDHAAVGCLVDSCRSCTSCMHGHEQFCLNGAVFTYGGNDRHSGGQTYGGYSERIVVDEAFVLRIGAKANLAATAPLLCAGITTWSPLRRAKVGKGMKVGVVGLGGLGHMAIKFASAFGA
ncbi:MAG: NAD(P)-dependent alcohol dehydrogenase, partial [Phycisphaerae bacterium]|nr:NAD(P)-dependent alcohol dehydrogenase [Phycisphaerae bacterium]